MHAYSCARARAHVCVHLACVYTKHWDVWGVTENVREVYACLCMCLYTQHVCTQSIWKWMESQTRVKNACVFIYACVCVFARARAMYAHKSIWAWMCVCVCVCFCVPCMHTKTFGHRFSHRNIYIYIYIYIHTHTYGNHTCM